MAPLDIKFNSNGTEAYIAFHGSCKSQTTTSPCLPGSLSQCTKRNKERTLTYSTPHPAGNRNDPVGYKLSVVSFANGQPVEPPTSTTAAKDILSNADLSACPGKCFRPVGLAIDDKGRIFMSSDSTGEIYVLQKGDMTALGGGSSATSTPNVGPRSGRYRTAEGAWMAAGAAVLGLLGGMLMVAI